MKVLGAPAEEVAACLIITAVLTALLPPWKMEASPSFMALSAFLSLLFYYIVDACLKRAPVPEGAVEYIGMKPIRYWASMFVLLVAPINFYALAAKLDVPLGVDWPVAAACSLLAIPFLCLASMGIDRLPQPSKGKSGLGRRF